MVSVTTVQLCSCMDSSHRKYLKKWTSHVPIKLYLKETFLQAIKWKLARLKHVSAYITKMSNSLK